MAVSRFYCPGPLLAGEPYFLPEAIARHAGRALRLREGDTVILFDGTGGEVSGTLGFAAGQAYVQLGAHNPREAELTGHITLVQGLASGDKMDWIIEKAVELGVARIVPIAARRSVVQLSGQRRAKRKVHWQGIISAACEQCGRNRLPEVVEPVSLADWLAGRMTTGQSASLAIHGELKRGNSYPEPKVPPNGGGEAPTVRSEFFTPPDAPLLLCHPESGAPLAQALNEAQAAQAGALSLLVGPEGGWADEEIALARRYGAHPLRFGPRVLRTETAGLALIAATTTVLGWGD